MVLQLTNLRIFFLLLKNFSFKRFSPEKDISEKREEENGEKSENIGRE